jgi:multidrug efflux pump subunit AcrB
MRQLVTKFIQYPFYSNMIIFVLVIGGLIGILNTKKSFFPETRSRDIIVNVFYPGASPKEMEEGITARIEEAVRGLVGIKEINSTSSENFSNVRITTTGDYPIDIVVQDVKNAVDGISSMPSGAERPIVFKQRNTTPAINLGIAGEDIDLLTLKKYAMEIEDDFRASGVMSQIFVGGYPDLEISIEISEENLLRYNITFDEVQRAVAQNNTDISAGQIKSDTEEIVIRSRRRSVEPNSIGDIVVRANADGSFIRIRDIGEVKTKFADVSSAIKINGATGAWFGINKLVDEDLKEIARFVENYTEEFNASHDKVKMYITFNFFNMLKARLAMLYKNGGIGLLLVIIVLGFFLSIRLSFWVAFGIPASFLGMFIVGSLYGITINMISLFGMILVVGILVDDGIVIAENIYAHFERGKSPRKAAVDGALEVLPAVLTSVTTTMVAFSPVLIIKEGGMEFMHEMAFVVIASLAFSLVEAFLVLPAHLGHSYILRTRDAKEKSKNIRQRLDAGIAHVRDKIYGRLLKWVIKWRIYVVIIPVALFLITAGLFGGGMIKWTFFPVVPFDFFDVDVAFTPGSGEKQTLAYLKDFENTVWEVNEELMEEQKGIMEKNNDTVDIVQYTFTILGESFDGVENGAHSGRIFVMLRDMDKTGLSSMYVAQRIREKIGRVPEAAKFKVGGGNRWGKPVAISLLGKDFDELEQAEQMLLTGMQNMDELTGVVQTNAAGKREVLLDLKPKAYFLGLNHAAISQQVRQGFFGGQAQRLQDGKDELRVWVRYPKGDRLTLGQMENMKIKTAFGEFPLKELADYRIERGPVNIKRYNMSREIRIESDLADPYAPVPPILENIEKNILAEMKQLYPGVDVEYQGQSRSSSESMNELGVLFLLAIVVIAIIIMIHFKSALEAGIILLMIPISWLGAAWGHGIEGIPVSLLSMWGMVALSGVIINDAVVFLSKYNLSLREGMKVTDAIYQAGISRFRPIILTTLTTTVGLYPIILEKSFQAQFLRPMAVALAYGVFIGTIFILIFFPAMIMFMSDFRVLRRWLWTGKKPAREEVAKTLIYMKREQEKLND